mmetsp:Transcript_84335/g.149077  ORF Transcript_84335/g.149077 Transcript_84335/m.149077 type:complete len:284 (+) Transcript_84335:35-886(+)|eukprot:CAMPEP_0197623924 /NCGR_PEP_ID=MMETSP1338-20131121/3796_1 /TAXON_ID=43686 ORGANISM="Pelagodinium beii, Strain RCC1491" /NCGR_SAMPLE_ID=MMETSP1338 /ASSEMBLY_ACC=CAM_ASM_000754 /LENGTH=283 /DNA_ID=CAMNT_0043194017 /DNA_START=35 /DNA_END=886 /DNA_ORIENTATION=+
MSAFWLRRSAVLPADIKSAPPATSQIQKRDTASLSKLHRRLTWKVHDDLEKQVVEEVAVLKQQNTYRHPLGGAPGEAQPPMQDLRSFMIRNLWYWTGLHGKMWFSVMPVASAFEKNNATWFHGLQLYSSIFGVAVLEICLTKPVNEQIGLSWAWVASQACVCFLAPTLLVLIPISFLQPWVLAAVPQERLREFMCRHAVVLGLPYRVGVINFSVTYVALGLRLYALYQFDGSSLICIMAMYSLGTILAFVLAMSVLTMHFEVMMPWEDAVYRAAQQINADGDV